MSDNIRASFQAGARAFVELVSQVRPEQWAKPGLGIWDIRGLVGHTSRALSTVETYLSQPTSGPPIDGPVAYFVSVLGDRMDTMGRRRLNEAIAERGIQAGSELGEDPAARVSELAQRVLHVVDGRSDVSLLATPAGAMTLADYLSTRTFELAVHSLDLARALDLAPPTSLTPAVSASCELAGALAGRLHNAAEVLLALTGRSSESGSFSIL
ncbi:MAG: maleylpyruvate isomerase N-terminal domain-containing protein [Actinobacteria bacterium]|nr:maleylpyruvate isomerase N-terminal domain-containing protein [Actinomycetota bacterium]